ncbi:MAG: SpoIID/LytB domain-containing protein [Bacteroidales bacterium]|nr:SpoIID/LytB domain-containing protein [Bacteroidales bacterium]
MSKTEPLITVGILTAPEIHFHFTGNYFSEQENTLFSGDNKVGLKNKQLLFNGKYYNELQFVPEKSDNFFTLNDVTIGVDFHWQRKENQSFRGILRFQAVSSGILAINIINTEDYLKSVIASEMNGTASMAFLKAHAVISRSWLLAQIENQKKKKRKYPDFIETEHKRIRWYDREDHILFNVCADDHCQRYQGITRHLSSVVMDAIENTRGEVLTYNGNICDTRFSKCCGGITEEFQNCWENEKHPYMPSIRDTKENTEVHPTSDNIEDFIRSHPDSFCRNPSGEVLSEVMNDYDCETTDFYRWTKEYTQEELSGLLFRRTGVQFGKILSLSPLKRGPSGRISELRITGSLRTVTIGKELEIRKALSPSHLYSSAFTVDATNPDNEGFPSRFILHGAGWGHGVGLCQIGAAVMGHKGYSYDEILKHYYPTATLQKIYE